MCEREETIEERKERLERARLDAGRRLQVEADDELRRRQAEDDRRLDEAQGQTAGQERRASDPLPTEHDRQRVEPRQQNHLETERRNRQVEQPTLPKGPAIQSTAPSQEGDEPTLEPPEQADQKQGEPQAPLKEPLDWQKKLIETTERLEAAVSKRLETADRAAAFIDHLSEENQRLKRHDDERKLEAFISSLAAVSDGLTTLLSDTASAQGETAVKFEKLVRGITVQQRRIIELLRRYGATDFEPNIGDRFDPERHVPIEPVTDLAEDGALKVSRVYRIGFETSDRVLRPATVAVTRDPTP